MISYVITIMDNPRSVQAAQRCIKSMPEFNIQMFPAITPADNPLNILQKKGIPAKGFDEVYSYKEKCVSAFLSHHTLWEKCVEDSIEYQIFEHDAVGIGNIPNFINYDRCISIGKPSYGRYKTPSQLGVNPLTSKRYFPGAHAYRVKPRGAKEFISKAKTEGMPTDVYLHLDRFPWLQEYYPWGVEAKDSFTTIQKPAGCLAKHNWNDGIGYDIL